MLKKITLGLAALLLGLLVSGCELILEPGDGPPVGGLSIYDAYYSTNYQDGYGTSYICDDRTTLLSYGFDYRGDLWSWSSYLEGDTTGQVKGYETFYPSDPRVHYGSNHVEVTYYISPYTAPLSVPNAELSLQSIVVVPAPQVIGYSRLYLNIDGYDRYLDLNSGGIPVISNC